MDKRKSIVMEGARDSPEDTIRPIQRRRSSILPRTNSDPLEVNDDSVERGRTRHETVTSPSVNSHSRRSLNLASVAQFTNPQIVAGIAECIKLNTQNKITKKNVYSLKLIDFMTYMVKSSDENMSNLQVASTTLDVSAKIYGLRVDVLHQETMDMMGNLDHETQDNPDDRENENPENTGTLPLKEKLKVRKKKKSTKIFTTLEALCCEPEIIKVEPPLLGEGDYQTSDMLLQITAPKHVGLGLGIHPYNDYILDHHEPKPLEVEKIPWTPIEIPETAEIGKIFTEFEFLNWDSEYDAEGQANDSVINNPMRFDLDASFHADDDDAFHNPDYLEDNQEVPMEVEVEAGAALGGNAQRRENLADVNDIVAHITTTNDYSYFDEKALNICWRSGRQWTVKMAPKNFGQTSHLIAQRQETARKKKDYSTDFRKEHDETFQTKFVQMKKVKRKFKSHEEKVTKPEESAKDLQEVFKFSLRPEDTDLQPRRAANVAAGNEEDLNLADYGSLDDSRHFDHPVDNDHSMEREEDNLSTQNDGPVQEEAFTQGGFTGMNLVEAPKLTEKIYLPFSQRAKKLDMRHLKKCIWNSLSMTEDKENVNNVEDAGEKQVAEGTKPFADVYTHLPEKLSKNDARELSFPIAFVSLLHLANEKNLKLTSADDHSDIFVMQDAG